MIHGTAIIDDGAVIGNSTKIWAWTHICKGASIGEGCTIGERVYIGPGVRIGNHCKIQNHALIYEGATIEDEVFIGPAVIITNDALPKAVGEWIDRFRRTLIERGASIGAHCTIIGGNTVGYGALVGAGSVVTKTIRPGWIAFGNPAHHIRKL